MKQGLEWYPREPLAFLGGIQGLPAAEIAVYSVVLDLIYAHGGEINNDPKWISGWIGNMGSAAVRNAIASLVERGKLEADETKISQKRARNEVKTRRKRSETAQETGRKGGISSGKSRSTSSENRYLDEANASPPDEPSRVEKSRESRGGGYAGAHAREDAPPFAAVVPHPNSQRPTYRERLLRASGADPTSGLIGPNGRQMGTAPEMVEAERWLTDLGLTEDQVVEAVTALVERKRDGPPTNLKYFTRPLERLAGELNDARNKPMEAQHVERSDRERGQRHPVPSRPSAGANAESERIARFAESYAARRTAERGD